MDNENNQPAKQPRQMSPPPTDSLGTPQTSSEESRQQLQNAIRGSNEVLATATTVLKLFPDTLTVDRAKLTVTNRTFFQTAEVMSMRIEDVMNVTCKLGPFLGSVTIHSRIIGDQQPYTIGLFSRKDAMHLKRITQGYVIAMQRQIDCSALPTGELVTMLDQLGQDDHPVG
jgi:hypothetical protein